MKEHRILDKNVVLGTVLLELIAFFWVTVVPIFGAGNDTLTSLLVVPGAVIALLVFDRIFKGEFLGFVRGGDSNTGLRLVSVMILYFVFLICQMLFCGEFAAPTLKSFANACAAGFAEEVVFRGYLITFLLRHRNNTRAIPRILVASSVLFGVSHLLNINGGAPLGITIMQVIGAVGLGAVFGAVYMRSSNLLIVIVAHSLTDLIAFMDSVQISEDGIMIADLTLTNYIDIAICIGMFAYALYLVRPEKREEIISLWDKKWRR